MITYFYLIPQLNEFEGELTDSGANFGYIGLVFGENPKIEKNIKLKNFGRNILVPPLNQAVIKFIK